MGLPAGTTITWYGHSCIRIDTAGGKTVLIDPWFGNPTSPMSADAVERCDLLLVTHGHFDHMGDAVALASRLRPIWPCMHEMSLWLARRLPGGADAAIGMNKGGTVEAAGLRVTMVGADHSAGDWNAGGETTLYLGEPGGVRHRARGRLSRLPRRRHAGLRRHGADPRPAPPGPRDAADRRALHDGSDGRGAGRRAARRQGRRAAPLRDVPDPDRHAGPAGAPRWRREASAM